MKKYIVLILICLMALGIVFFSFRGTKKTEKETAVLETEDFTNKMLNKDDGKSDHFYKGQNTETVYVNVGNNTYNITDYIVDWEFGIPIVNLNKIAEIIGIEFSDFYEKDQHFKSYQVFAPEEKINPEDLKPIYLIGNNDTYIKYVVSTGLVESGHSSVASASQISSSCRVRDLGNKEYAVSVTMLPYIDTDGNVYPATTYQVQQEGSLMTFVLKK